MQERADKVIQDGYYTEFFIFGGKDLKRIDPAEIDYIDIKIQDIKNNNDNKIKNLLFNFKLTPHFKLSINQSYPI